MVDGRKASICHVFAECGGIVHSLPPKLLPFLEREGEHVYVDMPPCKECGEFGRQHMRIAACDVQVSIGSRHERVDDSSPSIRPLGLIEEDIGPGVLGNPGNTWMARSSAVLTLKNSGSSRLNRNILSSGTPSDLNRSMN